ncbi:lysosome membrane protein 2 [Ictalurus punctatus]|uniref:Lysosome membrane protein 2 n=1 Tax=Ictalurus punctatus TaxID=7998 RepID=A0A2D0SYC6_ICTPU|nr:lysosome membrane protein 2 [Ictalurus punctatus]
MMKCKVCLIYTSIALGVLMLIGGIGIILAGDLHARIENKLKGEITLTEGSKVFQSWKNPPPPVFMEFFFFNVTNPDGFMIGEKPRLTHMGPYTYREYRPKANVTFVENGAKVSALTPKTFVFVPEMSAGDPSVDLVTTVNIPAVAVMNKLKGVSFWVRSGIAMFMSSIQTTMFMTHTVDELLWGFKDPLLSRLRAAKPEVDENFGLMLYKNGSNDGEFVYYTGEKNYLDYGRIDTWKGEKLMSFWATNQSNMINGTDGSAFHPFLTKEERLNVFTADLCRSIHMFFEKEVVVKGIPAYRYTPPRAVLASGKNNPENEGFCLEKDKCLDDGVLNVAVCRKGAPVIVSFPHFYLADKKYVDAIEGISPVHEHHQTFLDLNPTTGVPVRAAKRAQINIKLDRVTGFPMTRNLNGTIFPIMFLNESVVIDDASAQKLQKLLLIVKIVPNFPYVLMVLGAVLSLIGLSLFFLSHRKKSSGKTEMSYTSVNRDDPVEKNGTYIGLTPVEKS